MYDIGNKESGTGMKKNTNRNYKKYTKVLLVLLVMMIYTFITTTPEGKDLANRLRGRDPETNQVENTDKEKPGSESGTNEEVIGNMTVHFFDVRQADAVLFQVDGQTLLYDAGDIGTRHQLVEEIKSLGVTKLDYVVASHPHADHIGGMSEVIEAFDIGQVIMSPRMHTTKLYERVLDAMIAKDLKAHAPKPGEEFKLGNATVTMLTPFDEVKGKNLNNWSVGIKVAYGETSFVLTGDAEVTSERLIAGTGLALEADVFKAGHHGSNTSNSKELLDKVTPDYVVISVGAGNKYNHPDKEAMDMFAEYTSEVYRTDLSGTIKLTADAYDNIKVETEK